MMTTSNGLDMLNQQRERGRSSSRTVPPSRHTPRPAPSTAAATPPIEPAKAPAAAAPIPEPESPPGPPGLAAGGGADELIRSTIHVDAAVDSFLEEVRSVGRRRTPKVDATRSAVVRLAVARLAAQLTADQVVDELAARGKAAGGGRPRR